MEMLQTLLADRFALKVHKEVKPLPGYALTVSRKLQLKEADGSGDTRLQNASAGWADRRRGDGKAVCVPQHEYGSVRGGSAKTAGTAV